MPYKKMNDIILAKEAERLLNEWYALKSEQDELLAKGDAKGAYEAQKAAESKHAEYMKAKAEMGRRQ